MLIGETRCSRVVGTLHGEALRAVDGTIIALVVQDHPTKAQPHRTQTLARHIVVSTARHLSDQTAGRDRVSRSVGRRSRTLVDRVYGNFCRHDRVHGQ